MRRAFSFCAVSAAITCLSMAPNRAVAACLLSKLVELPVTMSSSKPIIAAKINGKDASFVADSGAFYSMLTEAAAAEYKLKLTAAPFGLYVRGIGGHVDPSLATVREFTIAGIPVHNVQFLVGGSTLGVSENVGLLGQNFFRIADVEYDLANGAIRLMRARGCEHAVLAYWAKPSEPYSVMDIDSATAIAPHTTGTALINGSKIRVMFDTGAGASILSQRAAERAGINPDSEGVVDAGYNGGIGRSRVRTYIGRFFSFKIGDEEIKNIGLRFGEIGIDATDMLIGADFFLSHRIYVASSQRKLFFTYNGGHVFNLTAPAAKAQAEPAEKAKPTENAEAADAGSYSRRGAALTARHDYQHAIADLTRACELDPKNASYFYQRGVAYRDDKQIDLATADFDRALELSADDLAALQARAQLRLMKRDIAGASADLDSAARAAPTEADLRFFLARAYQGIDLLPAAIAQYDLWIAAHSADSRLAEALNSRCWVRALQGQELAKALSDCDGALKLAAKSSPLYARILDSRGLVRLRMGDYGKSIADYDDSLKLNPKDPWSLYGRGVARTRQKNAAGEADMTAATSLWAPIGAEFKRRGITP